MFVRFVVLRKDGVSCAKTDKSSLVVYRSTANAKCYPAVGRRWLSVVDDDDDDEGL